MVQISDLYPGIQVQIVSKRNGSLWNLEGKMDHWLGKCMTVRSISRSTEYVRMEEDEDEHNGAGWLWYPEMIECIVEDENVPDAPALDNLF